MAPDHKGAPREQGKIKVKHQDRDIKMIKGDGKFSIPFYAFPLISG
jgi:hypothetical protein